jgi:hypothetical protein
MSHQLTKSERARVAWRRQAAVARRRAHRREPVQVVLDWSSPLDAEAVGCHSPVNLELDASSSAIGGGWRCRELSGASWVEAISAAHCTEVVLTARLGDDRRARHLVLELVELLTQRLSATKPYIRVRFLPSLNELGTSNAQSA